MEHTVSTKQRLARIETYFDAHFMSASDVQLFVDALLLACQLHTDPETFAQLKNEFDEILDEARRRDWTALYKRSAFTPGGPHVNH
jgi:hypothetical protein